MVHSNKQQEMAANDPQVIEKYEIKSNDYGKKKLDFRKYTKQIWLAGLGAFSKAEEEGNKLFDSLVQIGAELEYKTNEMTDHAVERISGRAKGSVIETKDKIEKLIDQGVHRSLNKLGLVTVEDLHRLENLVLNLNNKLDILIEENKEIKKQIREK